MHCFSLDNKNQGHIIFILRQFTYNIFSSCYQIHFTECTSSYEASIIVKCTSFDRVANNMPKLQINFLSHNHLYVNLMLSIPLCWVIYTLFIWLLSKHNRVLLFLVARLSHI